MSKDKINKYLELVDTAKEKFIKLYLEALVNQDNDTLTQLQSNDDFHLQHYFYDLTQLNDNYRLSNILSKNFVFIVTRTLHSHAHDMNDIEKKILTFIYQEIDNKTKHAALREASGCLALNKGTTALFNLIKLFPNDQQEILQASMSCIRDPIALQGIIDYAKISNPDNFNEVMATLLNKRLYQSNEEYPLPLQAALQWGDPNIDIVKLLCQYNADVNIEHHERVKYADANGSFEHNNWIVEKSTLLREAISRGKLDICKELIKANANVNFSSTNDVGYTQHIYHLTASKEDTNFFKALVDSGRLVKDEGMQSCRLNGQSLDELFDAFYNFNEKAGMLKAWIAQLQIHSMSNLFYALDYFYGAVNPYPENGEEHQRIKEEAINSIKEYMCINWHKSLLICKEFFPATIDSSAFFALPEKIQYQIGEELFNSYLGDVMAEGSFG